MPIQIYEEGALNTLSHGLWNVPEEVYHADATCLTNSGITQMLRSPLHWHAAFVDPNRPEKKKSEALELGSAVHAALLEPDKFSTQYVKGLDLDKRCNANKDAHAAFQLENEGKVILDAKAYTQALSIHSAASQSPAAALFKGNGYAEVTGISQHHCGATVKSRMDYFNPETGIIVDIKTCEYASPAAFKKSVVNYGYHRQAAFYSWLVQSLGLPFQAFQIVAVEKSYPYAIGVYTMDFEALQVGWWEVEPMIRLWQSCRLSGNWHGYLPQDLALPSYATYEYNQTVTQHINDQI